MSCCGPLKNLNAFSGASGELLSKTSPKYAPKLQSLLNALDEVEVRMRAETCPVKWKPSNFPTKIVPYGQKPSGTQLTFDEVPIYFQNNDAYTVNYKEPSQEGGICAESTLCGEIEGWQVPGDTYSTISYSMKQTAIDTPLFCLRDLLHKENGMEYLARFLKRVERAPAEFFDNYIRNEIWNVGEKYFLHHTNYGPLFNTPGRVTNRQSPDWLEFSAAGGQELSGLTLKALQAVKYKCKQTDAGSCLHGMGGKEYMMVGNEFDFWMAINEQECGTCTLVEGGMGFNPFSFKILNQIPYAIKYDDTWFRVEINKVTGEVKRIPRMAYYDQNGGQILLSNPAWENAEYGVFTIMEPGAFKYLQFGELPNIPGMVPEEVYRNINSRFDFGPKYEVCNYRQGLVAWRADHEFDFMYTGATIKHIIYKRDHMSAVMREVGEPVCINAVEDNCTLEIPNTCGKGSLGKCCVATLPDYKDSGYTLEITPQVLVDLGLTAAALPAAAQLRTCKGVFDIEILCANTAENMITFGVDPEQHSGGHFCCEDQIIGFVTEACPLEVECSACFEGGVGGDCYDATGTIYGGLLNANLDAAAGDVATIQLEAGCGTAQTAEVTIVELEGRKIKFEIDPADFEGGFPCGTVKEICANNTAGCEDCLEGPEQEPCEVAEADPKVAQKAKPSQTGEATNVVKDK